MIMDPDAPDMFRELEDDMDLFSVTVDGVPVWERVRFSTFREIQRQSGLAFEQPESSIQKYLRGFFLWMKNTVWKTPFFAGECEFLFFGHPRRKLEDDGYWWDLYCDPVHERNELDYVHVENSYKLSHRQPAKTGNIRYNDFIQYTGTIQRKLGIGQPKIPDSVISHLREAESEIKHCFNSDINLVETVRQALHVRNTTLPLYEYLLKRLDPTVVVDVVSYFDETFIEACKRMDIPVVELQHGVIYDHHFGYSYPEDGTKKYFPDYLLTFGEFWGEHTNFPISDDHVIPVGYPYLEGRLDRYDNVEPRDQILFISQGPIGHELSQFALAVHEDSRIDHDVVYKIHPKEHDRWQAEYPQLAEADVTVVDEQGPPLYRLFAESSAQVGVGSTAVYEGLCFDLETFVFDTDGAYVLQPLITDGVATLITSVEELAVGLETKNKRQFDRERFFTSNAVENIICELQRIKSRSKT